MSRKYFYLLTAGLLLFCTVRAQIKKGEWLLGGDLSFQKQDNNPVAVNYPHTTYVTMAPSIGKAIGDNLVAGVILSYGYTKLVQDDGFNPLYTLKTSDYGAGFFVRRYRDLGSNFSLFLEGKLQGGYSLQKGRYEGSNADYIDSKGYFIYASMSAGVAYRITHRLMLETGFQDLGYAYFGHVKYNAGVTEKKGNAFLLGTNLNRALGNFGIGCRYVL